MPPSPSLRRSRKRPMAVAPSRRTGGSANGPAAVLAISAGDDAGRSRGAAMVSAAAANTVARSFRSIGSFVPLIGTTLPGSELKRYPYFATGGTSTALMGEGSEIRFHLNELILEVHLPCGRRRA